ncbi:hypothetical protein GUJ93_ZPchr0013g36119 [Zizania palustris]|uniref:Dof zinc finger protein n=1 Tax=Zizania palustris TaxID=103762 RepID=A0A8J5X2E7_ZIZPA|nr:hypothetical protein GUJ93_ZPchr0013g36119 [Zizania palustris]
MIQELLGGTAMDQLKAAAALNAASLPMVLQPMVSNPSPTSSSSTSSRSSAQAAPQQRSTAATSSPQAQQGAADQQPRHFCKTCRRYWTKGGALRNVPIGGGCRKPRPMPAPVAKPPASCKAMPPLGLGVGVGGGPISWASGPQAATAHLMALLNSARGVQGHGGSNVHRLLGLDTMGHLQVLPGAANAAGTAASLWPQPSQRQVTPPHMDPQFGMGTLGHHDVLSSLGLKLPSSASSSPAASYYSDQLHAVVSNAGRPQAYDASASLPCTTAVTSLPASLSSVSAAPSSITVGMDLPPVSFSSPEMQYWSSPAAMSVAWPDLPTPNGAFP